MKPPSPLPPSRAQAGRALGAVALLAFAVAVTSCSWSRPAPPKRTFLLDPAAPAAAASARPADVRVGVVNVAGPFRGKAFVYREGEFKYEADYYDEFFVAPAAMLTEATATALTSANVFRRVVPPGARSDEGDYALDGFASELYVDMRDPAKPAAVLAIAFYLSAADTASTRVVWSRGYRQRVAFAGTEPEAAVRAWNAALSAVYADLARDLAAVDLPKK